MVFQSFDFLIFFGVILLTYWLVKKRERQNLLLLLGSYFFYGYVHPWFLILIFVSTVNDYYLGAKISQNPERKRFYLIASLFVNLGLLGYFKYFNFFIRNFNSALKAIGLESQLEVLEILLPVGISFYTFQTMSYTLEIYKGKQKPVKSFLDFALYVCFFPQLVAGPIERSTRFLPQILKSRVFQWSSLHQGLLLMAWGFFQKLVISNNVAVIANKVMNIESPSFFLLWSGVLAFCIQIYADFSGYTDIARGAARMMGFNLIKNFHFPYIATNPRDFWNRWHISLSTWFRDYVYIPLGGSRKGPIIMNIALLVTFLVSGLWHGASWNFIFWGGYHAALLIGFNLFNDMKKKLNLNFQIPTIICVVLMFALTNIGWLFFREQSMSRIFHHLLLNPFNAPLSEAVPSLYNLIYVFFYSLPVIILHVLHYPTKGGQLEKIREKAQISLEHFGISMVMTLVLGFFTMLLYSKVNESFIYFQF
jgi:D-alanyl-lipoteichoic acid acyltransferase DltB (MBOAT superfamily)